MCLGIDVHKRNSYVAVLDTDGEVIEEGRVENTTLEEIAQQYAGNQAVIEATTNYYAIYDTLARYLDVTVANPAKTRVIAEADLKNDRVDAKRLAHLLRAGLVAPPKSARTLGVDDP